MTLHDLDQANAKPQGGQERLGRVAVSESLKLEATGSPSRLVSLLGIAVHRIYIHDTLVLCILYIYIHNYNIYIYVYIYMYICIYIYI